MRMRNQIRSFAGRSHLRDLLSDTRGVTIIETAFITPIILLMGVGGLELANFAVINMRLNQAAVHITDNASRIGANDLLAAQRVDEADINDLLIGLDIQAGEQIDLYETGRVIISSLERNDDGGQWIHWQRCKGKKNVAGAYGGEGTGAAGTGFPGMGEDGARVTAPEGGAVIYVEIYYDYQPMIDNDIANDIVGRTEVGTTSAFIVRSTRDLSRLFRQDATTPQATCDVFDA